MDNMPHDNHAETNKPKSKLLIFGGVGCLLMLLLCVGGFGMLAYYGQDLSQEMMNVEADLLTSTELEDEIGSPVTVKPSLVPEVNVIDGVNQMTLSGIVSGPGGEGTYRATFTGQGVQYDRQSLTVEVNGKQIDISDEEELNLGIDSGE